MENIRQRLSKEQGDSKSYEEQIKREYEDARVEIEDLNDVLKTKDRMLEDQNIVISEIKEKMKEREAEVQ